MKHFWTRSRSSRTRSSTLGTTVASACARLERFLGRYEQAHVRLVTALRGLPEPASVESVGLLIELTVNEFYRSRYEAMHDWAGRAASASRSVGDAPLTAYALAMAALANAITGPTERAHTPRRSRGIDRRALGPRPFAPPRRGGMARGG